MRGRRYGLGRGGWQAFGPRDDGATVRHEDFACRAFGFVADVCGDEDRICERRVDLGESRHAVDLDAQPVAQLRNREPRLVVVNERRADQVHLGNLGVASRADPGHRLWGNSNRVHPRDRTGITSIFQSLMDGSTLRPGANRWRHKFA